jgi:hypothetical protein
MMPEQRTYSEWLNSQFASTGVDLDKRFGGDHPTGIMNSCQDCHMPKHFGGLCAFWDPKGPVLPRPDIAEHSFVGANTWVLGAILDQYGEEQSFLTTERVQLANQRVTNFLRNASDMQTVQLGGTLKTRVINYSGHKLPTGYPEGRRMWLNVKFYDAQQQLLAERGAYNAGTAVLTTNDTKVYEARLGMDAATAAATNLPAGESFHLVLNNQVLKDNRIPPIGFSNAAFQAVQAAPVNYAYADGQYWDDTAFAIPKGAAQAVVTLNYQTTSKEYIEFLRDAINPPHPAGQNAYDRWVARGKSAPVDMDMLVLALGPALPGDVDHNGVVNIDDLLAVISGWGPCPPPNLCESDVDGNGSTNIDDLLLVISNWG